MSDCEIFYSWQSDLPNATNWGFIQKALEGAAKAIREDDTVHLQPLVERDTAGVPGSPDIADTIFEKIERAQIFVCDVSITSPGEAGKPTPNPNVLFELGYAAKVLGFGKILLVMNTAFGGPEKLPFDLRQKRVLKYCMPQAAEERGQERRRLQTVLEMALRAIIEGLPPSAAESPAPPTKAEAALAAVEESRQNQALAVSNYTGWLADQIDALAPSPEAWTQPDVDDEFVKRLGQTKDLMTEFARLASAIAGTGASEAASALYQSFSRILEKYYLPPGFSGSFFQEQFDFHKFIGHELFVIFFAALIRDRRWELITDLLEETFYISNARPGEWGAVTFERICQSVSTLDRRNRRLSLGKLSVHALVLNERHTQGDLGVASPMADLIDADYFLFLRSQLSSADQDSWDRWHPWSIVYMRRAPRFLIDAERRKNAERLLRPLGVNSVEELRSGVAQRGRKCVEGYHRYGFFSDPLMGFKANVIGTK